MKEVDSISRLKVELERKDNLERQLQIAESPVERLLRETRRLERIVPKSPLAMGRLYMEDSSIALIEGIARTCREGEKAQALRMHDAILQAKAAYTSRTEMMMESMRSAVEMARSQFASQGLLTFGAIKPIDDRWLRGLESASSRIAEVARINYAITEIALLHWNAKALAARAPLLEDCVFNLAALETFHAAAIVPDATISPERLGLAADFVFEHSEVVRHLPPQLPTRRQ